MKEVELHTILLKQGASNVAELWQTLSEKEKDRVNRFRLAEHKRRFIIVHGTMRQILAKHIGLSPEHVQFGTSSTGKPILMHDEGRSFSLSYSKDLAVLAVCQGAEIGVDIEWRHPDRSFLEMARRYFFPGETRYLSGLQEDMLVEEFYRIWTLKESWLKATGIGISGLRLIEVVLDQNGCYDIQIHDKNIPNSAIDRTDAIQWRYFDTLPGFTGCYTRLNSSQIVSTI